MMLKYIEETIKVFFGKSVITKFANLKNVI